jgi:uncharacterized protein YrrD
LGYTVYIMLRLSQALINKPVLSLRLGNEIATVVKPIINPNNLKIEGFYCLDRYDRKKSLVLLYKDIREIIPKGFIVNDHEVLSEPSELLRLKDILEINFELIGKPVVTVGKVKVGKVSDYATEESSLYIQKLYVGQSLVRNFTGGSLNVDRNQIVEITNRKIIIQDLVQGIPSHAAAPA